MVSMEDCIFKLHFGHSYLSWNILLHLFWRKLKTWYMDSRYFLSLYYLFTNHVSKASTCVCKRLLDYNGNISICRQLSDLNRDGELSLEEFCIAMHLVVLRRHEIEIPDRLPFSLMPYTSFTNGKDLCN